MRTRAKLKARAAEPPDAVRSKARKPRAKAFEPAPVETPAVPLPAPAAPSSPPAAPPAHAPLPDFERLAHNMARMLEEGGKVVAAYMKPRETITPQAGPNAEVIDAVSTLGKIAEYYLADPAKGMAAQAHLSGQFMALWGSTLQRLKGGIAAPVAPPEPGDKRFAHPQWSENPYFDFLKQAYLLTSRWAGELVSGADQVDAPTRERAQFYLRQLSGALSPSNFVATNPEIIDATLAENGENLVRGLQMMAEDIAAGHGNLRIRQTDARPFTLGQNMATTPGKVIARNELIELIQYAPSTPQVFRRPLLIVPPWINKFYVLDLNPEKSFIRWAVAQGFTVFVISWVNPDERHTKKDFEAYMREGIFAALEAITLATGERQASAIGYCVGGTLLAVTLAYMAELDDTRIASATLFTTQVDFSDAGDLKNFVDLAKLKSIEGKMASAGYLEGAEMASAFNMLRPNELIWSYFVNNYLKGREPKPFDLLAWNSDSTRMPAANHAFYLRHCYLQNDLTKGAMTIAGKRLDLGHVKIPIYNLAAREDHIAPAKSVFEGAKFFGGPVRYVMAGSGHIAGVVNPADKPKYQFWTGGPPQGAFADWVASAKETPGSWWPDWVRWMSAQAPDKVAAREPGAGKLKPLGDAPGEYVRVKS